MDTEAAANWLDLSPRTLEKKRVIGGGPKFRKLGRCVRYTKSDLRAWSEQNTFAITAGFDSKAVR